MPLINFKSQFSELVSSGNKTQTIRPDRKYPFLVGDNVYLYTGLRTKKTQKLGLGIIKSVDTIIIRPSKVVICNEAGELTTIILPKELDKFAKSDGFDSFREMTDFIRAIYGLPFEGNLVKWRLVK